jgi:serine/threonine-protein kinase HipA
MGALEFRPAYSLGREPASMLDISLLVDAARDIIAGSLSDDDESKRALGRLLSVGTSAGGARAKAVVNIDFANGRIVSGQRPKKGFSSWILKLDGVGADPGLGTSQHYGRIEYAYALMAGAAGIKLPEVRLLEENGRAHFMVKRFDRTEPGGEEMPEKIHMQSLCALGHIDFNLLRTNDYASLISVIRRLNIGEEAVTEAFRRMAFNCLAMNCDDHSKNFSFLMERDGRWRFAPAYDVTFAYNSQNIWLREHLMGVNGKYADITRKDLLAFADVHQIEYAKAALKDVRTAIDNWKDYAARAGLGKDGAEAIAAQFPGSI